MLLFYRVNIHLNVAYLPSILLLLKEHILVFPSGQLKILFLSVSVSVSLSLPLFPLSLSPFLSTFSLSPLLFPLSLGFQIYLFYLNYKWVVLLATMIFSTWVIRMIFCLFVSGFLSISPFLRLVFVNFLHFLFLYLSVESPPVFEPFFSQSYYSILFQPCYFWYCWDFKLLRPQLLLNLVHVPETHFHT